MEILKYIRKARKSRKCWSMMNNLENVRNALNKDKSIQKSGGKFCIRFIYDPKNLDLR